MKVGETVAAGRCAAGWREQRTLAPEHHVNAADSKSGFKFCLAVVSIAEYYH